MVTFGVNVVVEILVPLDVVDFGVVVVVEIVVTFGVVAVVEIVVPLDVVTFGVVNVGNICLRDVVVISGGEKIGNSFSIILVMVVVVCDDGTLSV